MRLLLGQLYDQRAALHLEQRYVGEVLIPQEHLCAHHLHEAVRFVVRKYPALRGCFTRSEGEWRMDFVAVDAFPVDQALNVVAAAPGVLPGAQVQASVEALLTTFPLTVLLNSRALISNVVCQREGFWQAHKKSDARFQASDFAAYRLKVNESVLTDWH
ncbi:hypothetical protein PPUJ20005_07140 [Pseudomonas putida]|jgi:hypothetical protein|uniref:hypothetical protein n=1 Tax=Pseudomonas putida TaxID=303 RepID=UPI00235C171C|nr:hypothetical protein [Pseudomonas putida]GLO06746.1 hypothetical protein PPUJ20005_07140 [Pseudomonas putida]HDS0985633.1 hypothetical protein [Pseudomonas putida]